MLQQINVTNNLPDKVTLTKVYGSLVLQNQNNQIYRNMSSYKLKDVIKGFNKLTIPYYFMAKDLDQVLCNLVIHIDFYDSGIIYYYYYYYYYIIILFY